MLVGTLVIQIHLHGMGSLKDIRRIVKSLITRLQNRYNLSVAEVDGNDNKNLAFIGLSVVSNDSVFINRQLDKTVDFIRADARYYVGTMHREIFSARD